MNNAPHFSVIMPAYNVEKYIEDAIKSVLAQTYERFTLIIVDDGSTDSTPDILKRFAAQDPRIQVITQSKSGKPAVARNIGLAKASGSIICFLDSDDMFDSNRLQRILEVFNCHPQVSLVFHDMAMISDDGQLLSESYLERVKFLDRAGDYLEKCGEIYTGKQNFYNFISAYETSISTDTIAVRSFLLNEENYFFPETMLAGEDIDLWFRLVMRARVAYIDEPLSICRNRVGSVTKDKEAAHIGFIDAHSRNLYRGRRSFSKREHRYYRMRIALECGYLAYHYRNAKDFKNSIRFYWRAFKYHKRPIYLFGLIKVFPAMLKRS